MLPWKGGTRAPQDPRPQGRSLVMGEPDETRERLDAMREKARELSDSAEHESDPKERERLAQKARRLESLSEQESDMRSGDIYPIE
ncbi:small hydrophilic protein [Streptomyces sp. SPB78]|nr:small hydrophilic protein [Streptomyces sp. SPB78]